MTDKPEKKQKAKMGRPPIYTEELADKICLELAKGVSLNKISKYPDMPSYPTMLYWTVDKPEFFNKYIRARQAQALHFTDETLEICDSSTPEEVQLAKLRIETRKWHMSKHWPKVFGDKMLHAGHDGGNVKVEIKDHERELYEKLVKGE